MNSVNYGEGMIMNVGNGNGSGDGEEVVVGSTVEGRMDGRWKIEKVEVVKNKNISWSEWVVTYLRKKRW